MGLQKREVQTAAILRRLPGPAAAVITRITVALQRDTGKIKTFLSPNDGCGRPTTGQHNAAKRASYLF